VTIDLRGIGSALHTEAAARGKTVAALVRMAVVATLDTTGSPVALTHGPKRIDERTVKVTLRLDAMHAAHLAERARVTEVSQGAYVADLLDGMPPSPKPRDHGDAINALADSTQKVAAMSVDVRELIRLMHRADTEEARRYLTALTSLSQDMRLHLQTASRLMAGLTSRRAAVHSKHTR
jgi:hypothetical protein